MKLGDKCLAVFRPSHLTNIEDGNVVECRLFSIEEVKTTTESSEQTLKKYRVEFGLETATIEDGFLFSLEQRAEANALAISLVEKSIAREKNSLEALEKCLQTLKT